MTNMRDTLIDAATGLLDAGGPERVTLREVGRLAGVSHNAPYRHFADKNALLAAVAAREVALGAERYRAAASGETSLRAALQLYVRRALDYPERFRLMYSESLQQDEVLEQVSRETRTAAADAVASAQARGELPPGDDAKLGWLLRACAYGATIRALDSRPRKAGEAAEPEALIAELFYHLGK